MSMFLAPPCTYVCIRIPADRLTQLQQDQALARAEKTKPYRSNVGRRG